MAGNQLGKTMSGAAEMAMHLTGLYPDWWQGRRFDHPVDAWAGSNSNETTRDNPQRALLGAPAARELWGTGAIPKRCIVDTSARAGVPDAVDNIQVRHVSGGVSIIGFKSYDQGRQKWQGPPKHLVWFDEEPPYDIYSEGLTRTNATGGCVYMTFTPLLGMSDVVRLYINNPDGARSVTIMTINDALHYTDEQRAAIIASYPPHERDARTKGIPTLGSGAVFPINPDEIKCASFVIPPHWPQIIALDFGWDHPTAAVKLAWDRDADRVYLVSAYKRSQATPIMHIQAIKAMGAFPVAWPHDGLQHDKSSGVTLAEEYRRLGLLMLPDHARHDDGGTGVEAGLWQMLQRMQTGRFLVFEHVAEWWEEMRTYHRKDGRIVKEHDDVISAARYGIMCLREARVIPSPYTDNPRTRMAVSDYDEFRL